MPPVTSLPKPLQRLIQAFERLPGIGPKTASRLAFYLLRAPDEVRQELQQALAEVPKVTYCQRCFYFAEPGQTLCPICQDPQRDHTTVCVVEDPLDVVAIERTGLYQGVYHVLHGVLSPIEGIGPEDLRIRELEDRIPAEGIREVILATNPSLEGDATAAYLAQRLKPLGVKVTRLAQGLPTGGDLEYADQATLARALLGRQEMT
ncbi:MAG: recombination protein RecR [Chloroflexi bacterium]|nr:recombination protein RecR [Chloroflexota bacterium]